MNGPDWHGWGIVGRGSLHVGRLPGRKSVCLYVVRKHENGGASIDTLAFFPTEEKACEMLDWLDVLAQAGVRRRGRVA